MGTVNGLIQRQPPDQQPVNELFDYAGFMWEDPVSATFTQSPWSSLQDPGFSTPPFESGPITSSIGQGLFHSQLEQDRNQLLPNIRDALPAFSVEQVSPSTSVEQVEEDQLIIYFLQAVIPPILEPIETGPKWTFMRSLFASMATASSMVRHAIKAFSALQARSADYRPFYEKACEELSTFFDAAETSPGEVQGQFQYMLAAIFLVSYIDVGNSRHIPTRYADSHFTACDRKG